MKSYSFTPGAARRIAQTVRRVEQMTDPGALPTFGEALPLPIEICRFELAEALSPGSSARAYRRWWTGATWETDTESEITVHDAAGIHRGRGKDTYASPHDRGSLGLAWKPHDQAEWEILYLQPMALLLRAAAAEAFETTDSTFYADGFAVMQPVGGIITEFDPVGSAVVGNPHKWDGDDDAVLTLHWNETLERYDTTEADCPVPE